MLNELAVGVANVNNPVAVHLDAFHLGALRFNGSRSGRLSECRGAGGKARFSMRSRERKR